MERSCQYKNIAVGEVNMEGNNKAIMEGNEGGLTEER